MRKFNVSIPVPTKDDIAAMANKAKDKAVDTKNGLKEKAVKAALNNEHTHNAMVEEMSNRGIVFAGRTPITVEDIQQREATNLLRRSLANTQTKEV